MFLYFNFIITWYLLIVTVSCNDYKGFDDTVLFKLNWPGEDVALLENQESLMVTTQNKEKYKCSIPNIDVEENQKETHYNGPTPLEIVSTLFSAATCSYRIESYWTYEVCHGSYIKQYHELREGKTIRMHEYFLGKWTKEKTNELQEKLSDDEKNGEKVRTTKIEGVNLPYLEMEMTDGTFCELNGEHRTTKVLYVCYPNGKNEVHSLKETSTCNYEVVILTPTLCVHPSFNPKGSSDNEISCVPIDGSPSKPRSLLMMEVENMKNILEMSRNFQRQRITVVKLDPKDGTLKAEIISNDFLPAMNKAISAAMTETSETVPSDKTPIISSKVDNTSPVMDFLSGKHCLTGGTGWWKYEFCYGRYVRQFHVDKNGETSVMLGYFNEELHKEWLNENPQKRPQKIGTRTHLSHFYQSGTICDKTGDTRQTEVQLKCLENSPSLTKVSLFLMEPKICSYILTVESPLICEIIEKANDDGLVPRNDISSAENEIDAQIHFGNN